MTDNRTYDAATTRQQLAETMTLCAQIEAKLADVQSALNLSEHLRQVAERERDAAQDMATAAVQAYRVEKQRADDAVAAYHVIAARLGGMGWWC